MKPSDAFHKAAHRIVLVVDDFREEHANGGGTRSERSDFTHALLDLASIFLAEAARLRKIEDSNNVVDLCDFRMAHQRRASV